MGEDGLCPEIDHHGVDRGPHRILHRIQDSEHANRSTIGASHHFSGRCPTPVMGATNRHE